MDQSDARLSVFCLLTRNKFKYVGIMIIDFRIIIEARYIKLHRLIFERIFKAGSLKFDANWALA